MVLTGWSAFWIGVAAVIIALGLFSMLENILKVVFVTHCINKTVKRITDSTLPSEQIEKLINSLVED